MSSVDLQSWHSKEPSLWHPKQKEGNNVSIIKDLICNNRLSTVYLTFIYYIINKRSDGKKVHYSLLVN